MAAHTSPQATDTRLTVEEAASRAGVEAETVLRWIRSGRLPAAKVGRGYQIAEQALESLLDPGQAPRPGVPGGVWDPTWGVFRRRLLDATAAATSLPANATAEMLTAREALELPEIAAAGVTVRTLRRWAQSGRVSAAKVGREYRFSSSDLLAQVTPPTTTPQQPVGGGIVDADWGPFARDPFAAGA